MAVSTKVKTLLNLRGKDYTGLAAHLDISKQALSNKFYKDSFSSADLVKVAKYYDTSLCFLSGDMNKVVKGVGQ